MKTVSDQNLFDLGDQTALVCIDHPQYQKMVVAQLTDLAYKVHLGLFEEDVLLKLATYNYNVIVVYENFKGARADENPILLELMKQPGAERREHFVILLSHRCATNDPLTAFAQSIDQIVNISDLSNFKPVLRRGLAQCADLYAPFREVLQAAQAR
jgi:hypothetical protein